MVPSGSRLSTTCVGRRLKRPKRYPWPLSEETRFFLRAPLVDVPAIFSREPSLSLQILLQYGVTIRIGVAFSLTLMLKDARESQLLPYVPQLMRDTEFKMSPCRQ